MQFRYSVSFVFVITTFSANLLAATPQQIDVNTATAQELDDALPGIGPSKAEAIVSYRNQHGAFNSLEDLDNVPGIGPKILKLIQNVVQFEDTAANPQQEQPQQEQPQLQQNTKTRSSKTRKQDRQCEHCEP